VIQITLPVMITILGVVWAVVVSQNRRLDDIVGRLTAIEQRLSNIEQILGEQGERITWLEERTPPLMAGLNARITVEPGKMGGKPCVRGLRFTVDDLASYLASGMTVVELTDDYAIREIAYKPGSPLYVYSI
jgi:uncharacterized protein (DUF433 family)